MSAGAMPAPSAMQGGFTDAVIQSQDVFRTIMDAMAHPGKICPRDPISTPPGTLYGLSADILLALADVDTPLWLDAALAEKTALKAWLSFQTGAPLVTETGEAIFAILSDGARLPGLEQFCQGLQDYPDRSTTLLVQVENLREGGDWILSGPGIKDKSHMTASPFSPLFLSQWAANNALFPRGVDLVLVSPNALACLPRTITLKSAGEQATSEEFQ